MAEFGVFWCSTVEVVNIGIKKGKLNGYWTGWMWLNMRNAKNGQKIVPRIIDNGSEIDKKAHLALCGPYFEPYLHLINSIGIQKAFLHFEWIENGPKCIFYNLSNQSAKLVHKWHCFELPNYGGKFCSDSNGKHLST